MEDKIIQILVQGGLASVALASLWINYKLTANHLSHSDRVIQDMEIAITKLLQFLEDKFDNKLR